jgi:predicted nucleic acid-binding protein
MIPVILDANVVLRFIDSTAGQHAQAVAAFDFLRQQGYLLQIVPQTLYEFWVVATRAVAANGLGFSPAKTARAINDLLTTFPLRGDLPTMFAIWLALVEKYHCSGKSAHDARYVAALQAHGLSHLLTFNVSDFTRYTGLTIIDPTSLSAPSSWGR